MPLGNDLLVLALCARQHERWPYYAAMAAAGSTLGCLLVDLVVRKGGERGLERRLSRRKAERVRTKVRDRAGYALAVASVMPSPFPFTPFVIAASAFQYPRRRLLAVVAVARFVRFSVVGVLAVIFGRHILRLGESPWVQGAILLLVVIAIGGSVLSILHWIRR